VSRFPTTKSEGAEGSDGQGKQENFDGVAFQRAQREKLGKKFETMSNGESNAWMRDYRPTGPILRRLTERARRGIANDAAIESTVPAEQSGE